MAGDVKAIRGDRVVRATVDTRSHRRLAMGPLLAMLLSTLAGCAGPGGERGRSTPTAVPATGSSVESRSTATPARASVRNLAVDGAASLLTIRVYRGGALAAAGHNHVIASHALTGIVEFAEPLAASRVVLRLPVASLTIDEPALRAQAGADFASEVPDSAREGTRRNLLSPALLDGADFPEILLESTTVTPLPEGLRLTVEARVRGQRSSFEVPVALRLEGATLVATGALELRQSQLGLVPFSVMMGALQVQDAMRLEFRVVARP